MTGKIMPLRERDTSTIQAAADAFLFSPRYANLNTRRGYTGVLDRLLAGLGASRPAGRGQRRGTGRPAGAALGAAGPGDLEPQPRRRGRLAVLVRGQPAARPGLAGQRRTAPRVPQRHPRGAPPGDRPGADSPRRSAAGEDPVADALRNRRPGQRGAGAEHRRPPAWTPAAPRSAPRAATPNGSAGARAPRTCCPASSAAVRPGLCSCCGRRPGPARRPAARDLCPATGRARLGYDRARILFTRYTGRQLHQLRPPRPPISASKVSRCS